ncbi:MAG: FAD-binding protein, partial [Rhodospirillales bacterium]
MQMPLPDPESLAKRAELIAGLKAIVPAANLVADQDGMRPYECDALSAYRTMPMVVVLPEDTAQVSRILKLCQALKIKVVPRGGGTSLSGGSLPLADGVLLALGKFNRVLETDFVNRCAVVQPGVTNLGITKAVEHAGFYYAPDPSSQIACSI